MCVELGNSLDRSCWNGNEGGFRRGIGVIDVARTNVRKMKTAFSWRASSVGGQIVREHRIRKWRETGNDGTWRPFGREFGVCGLRRVQAKEHFLAGVEDGDVSSNAFGGQIVGVALESEEGRATGDANGVVPSEEGIFMSGCRGMRGRLFFQLRGKIGP